MAINEVQLIDHTKDPFKKERFVLPATEVKQDDLIGNQTNGMQQTQNVDESGSVANLDPITHHRVIIESEHHEIHKGDHYHYCDYQLNLAINDIVEIIITTPDTTKFIHIDLDSYSASGITMDLYEGTTGVVGGTPIIPVNNNRNSSNTSVATIVKDPTSIDSDGIKSSGYIAGSRKTSGFSKRDNEIILKRNTKYLLRMTSLASSNYASWSFEWYEHINK